MRVYFRSVRMSCRRAVFTPRFLVAVFLSAILLILDLLPPFLAGIYYTENGSVRYSYDLVTLMELSGMTMFLGFTFITAVLPLSGVFCDDSRRGFLIPYVKNNSMAGYAAGNATACAVSSFLCVCLAWLLCLGAYALFIPVVGENFHADNFTSSLIQGGHMVLYLAAKVALYSLRGSFFSLVSLMTSVAVKHKYVIYAVPFLLFYFLMRFGYSILGLPMMLNVRGIYFAFVFGDEYELASLLYAFAFTGLMAVLAGMALYRKIRRCL